MTANELLSIGLTNAVLATLLAVCGWLLMKVWRNPHVAAVVWLVVLLKLVTPPLIPLPIALANDGNAREGEAPAEPRESASNRRAAGVSLPVTPTVAAPSEISFDAVAKVAPDLAIEPEVAPPVFAQALPVSEAGAPDVSYVPPTPRTVVEPASASPPISIPVILLTTWMFGIAVMAGVTALRVVRFRRCLKAAAISHHDVQREAVRVAMQLKVARCPAVRFVDANVGPMVWAGGTKPLIVVPKPLWESLDASARETLLAHELAHVVRRDHWVRRLEAVVLAAYWWLPTAWLAVRRRETAAETCCDALVLTAYPDRPGDYAEALFHAVSVMSTGRPLALASGLGRATELKERLAMIAHDRVPLRPNRMLRSCLALAAAGALLISARFVQADPAEETPKAENSRTVAPAAEQDASPATETPAAVREGTAIDPAAVEPEPTLDALLPDEGAYRGSYGPTSAAGLLPASRRGGAGGSRGDAMPMGGMSRVGMSPSGVSSFGGGGRGPGIMSSRGAAAGRGASRRAAVRPPDEAIAKMLGGLRKVIESPKEPTEVKIQALRSYGRLARGTAEQKNAEELLLSAVKNAKDDRTKLGAADALHTLGSPKGVELMWTLFAKSKDANTRATSLRVLDHAEAVPPTVESIRQLVTFTSDDMNSYVGGMPGMGSMMGGGGFPPNYPQGILRRLTNSGDGLQRLVKAAESFPADDAAGMEGGLSGGEGYGGEGYGGEGYGGEGGYAPSGMAEMGMGGMMVSPPRAVLLGILRGTVPESEDISTALVEALSSKDAGVRAAAAQALGNVSERERAEGAPTQGAPASRASIGAILNTPVPTWEEGPAPPTTAEPMPAVSESVRADLIESLSQAARDEKATSQSRIAALRSLAKVTQGTEHAAEARELAESAAKLFVNEEEKKWTANIALSLASDEELDGMWKTLPNASLSEQIESLDVLDARKATPPNAECVVVLANFALMGGLNVNGAFENENNAPSLGLLYRLSQIASGMLDRVATSRGGVETLLKAIELASEPKYQHYSFPTEWKSHLQQSSTPFYDYPARHVLIRRLAEVIPSTKADFTALKTALKSDVDDLRQGAAEAMGNVGKPSKDTN